MTDKRVYIELELEVPPQPLPPPIPEKKPEMEDGKVSYEVDLTVRPFETAI